MVWEGKEVVKYGRTMIGATNPLASAPGTIRCVGELVTDKIVGFQGMHGHQWSMAAVKLCGVEDAGGGCGVVLLELPWGLGYGGQCSGRWSGPLFGQDNCLVKHRHATMHCMYLAAFPAPL